MTGVRNGGRLATAACLMHALCLGAGSAAAAGAPGLAEEISQQDRIYQRRGKEVREGYVVDRSLAAYEDALSPGFDQALANLGPADRWLDIGAGRGQAILDYLAPGYDRTHPAGRERRGSKAQAVAISIEDRRTELWHERARTLPANQLRYLHGKRLREYAAEELGRFRVITDVVGGFSYTENLAAFMEKTLGLLELDGVFYTLLQDVRSEDGSSAPYYENETYTTELTGPDGAPATVCSWLKRISCAEVTCAFKTDWEPDIEVYHVRKVCHDITVPALETVHYKAGTPPDRRFRLPR